MGTSVSRSRLRILLCAGQYHRLLDAAPGSKQQGLKSYESLPELGRKLWNRDDWHCQREKAELSPGATFFQSCAGIAVPSAARRSRFRLSDAERIFKRRRVFCGQ